MVMHVQAGGKKRPVKFGMAALHQFSKITGINATKMNVAEVAGDIGVLAELFKAGFDQGCRISNVPVDYKLEDVLDWMDEPGVIDATMKAFVDSYAAINGTTVNELEKNAQAPVEGGS